METNTDILISRIVDREATLEDWAALKAVAAADPGVWFRLAQAQQDQMELSAGLATAIEIADGIEAPSEAASIHRFTTRFGLVRTWGGWAAAALVGLALLVRPGASLQEQTAGISIPSSASEALARYLDLGKKEGAVLGEVPQKYLVNTIPVEDGGGYEVIFVRQIIERAVVPELYRFGTDELGRPSPVRLEPRVPREPM